MKAYELLSNEDKWCRYVNHKDKDGKICDAESAVAHCAYGAILVCYSEEENHEHVRRMQEVIKRRYDMDYVVEWNDDPETTWKIVHNLLSELNI